jgi:hypothetical protein
MVAKAAQSLGHPSPTPPKQNERRPVSLLSATTGRMVIDRTKTDRSYKFGPGWTPDESPNPNPDLLDLYGNSGAARSETNPHQRPG